MQEIILNPFEYDKLFDGTHLLIELTDKYQVQVNLTKYSLNVKQEFIDDVRKIISDKLDDSSHIFAESEKDLPHFPIALTFCCPPYPIPDH